MWLLFLLISCLNLGKLFKFFGFLKNESFRLDDILVFNFEILCFYYFMMFMIDIT